MLKLPFYTDDRFLAHASTEVGGAGDLTPGGNGGATESNPAAPPAQDWGKFFENFTTELKTGNKAIADRLDNLTGTVVKASEPPPAPEPDADEINSMTNADFGNFLMNKMQAFIKSTFEAGIKPVTDTVNSLRQEYTVASATSEVNALKAQHKDFNDWNEEMVALATEHPTLPIPKLYALARADNPGKAKTLDAKYNPAPERPRLPFAIGSSGYVGSAGGGGDKPLSKGEASRQALEEVAGRHPVLQALLDQR